jgi:hypothetical protein
MPSIISWSLSNFGFLLILTWPFQGMLLVFDLEDVLEGAINPHWIIEQNYTEVKKQNRLTTKYWLTFFSDVTD